MREPIRDHDRLIHIDDGFKKLINGTANDTSIYVVEKFTAEQWLVLFCDTSSCSGFDTAVQAEFCNHGKNAIV